MTETPGEVLEERVERFATSHPFPPGGPHPSYGVVHFEFAEACVNELGWSPTLVTSPASPPFFRFPEGLPSTQMPEYQRAVEACLEVAVERGEVIRVEDSPEFRSRLYEALLEVYDCMVDHGYPVPPPPSREAFVAGEEDYDVYAETPAGGLLVAPPEGEAPASERDRRQYEIQQTCPAWFGALDLRAEPDP